jgi:NADH-quinone oxidoreductase subunit J
MTISFLLLAAITIIGTAAAMSLKNLVHCVLALTLGLVGLAALYLELGAQFVGFTQILVYVGAVAILAAFAIMMTRSAEPTEYPAP